MQFNIRTLILWLTLVAFVSVSIRVGYLAAFLMSAICIAVLFNYHITLVSPRRKILSCLTAVFSTASISSLTFAFVTFIEQPEHWSLGSLLIGFMIGFLLSVIATLPYYLFTPEPRQKYEGDNTPNREDLFPKSSWFGGGG